MVLLVLPMGAHSRSGYSNLVLCRPSSDVTCCEANVEARRSSKKLEIQLLATCDVRDDGMREEVDAIVDANL